MLTFFFFTATPTNAQDEQPFNISDRLPNFDGRLSSLSSSSPVATNIRSNTTAQVSLNETFTYIQRLSNVVEARRAQRHKLACNIDTGVVWVKKVRDRMQFFQIGELNDSCHSAIDVIEAAKDGTLASDYEFSSGELFRNTRLVLFDAISKITLPRNGNWSDPSAPYMLRSQSRTREGQTCSMENIRAIRKNSVWYLRAALTNRPIRVYAPDWDRQILQEWVANSYEQSLTALQPSLTTLQLENTTTFLTMWSGFGSTIQQDDFEDPNSPIAQAFSQNLVDVDLASDAITPSNIAILALPLVMNLVPIAFIADLNTFAMLSYVLVTDLFSTVPFLIKGVELIRSSRPREPVVFSFFAGNETIGEMQAWAVDCRGQERFRAIGIAFVVVAVAALIIGLLLELWANKFMTRLRANQGRLEKVPGPFGSVAMETTTRGLLGARETKIEREYLREADWWEQEMIRMSTRSNEYGIGGEVPWGLPLSRQRVSAVSVRAIRNSKRGPDDIPESPRSAP